MIVTLKNSKIEKFKNSIFMIANYFEYNIKIELKTKRIMFCINIMATQNTSSLISSVYKSRKTLLELMSKQGYNVEEYENFSINEVNAMFQNKQLDMLLEKQNNSSNPSAPKRKIYISYYLAKTLKAQNIQEMIEDLFNLEEILTKDDTLMIIVKDEMNETLMNLLKHIWEQDSILIVIQSMKRLQFNILGALWYRNTGC